MSFVERPSLSQRVPIGGSTVLRCCRLCINDSTHRILIADLERPATAHNHRHSERWQLVQ